MRVPGKNCHFGPLSTSNHSSIYGRHARHVSPLPPQRSRINSTQTPKRQSFPIKTVVKWVPGVYICIYIYISARDCGRRSSQIALSHSRYLRAGPPLGLLGPSTSKAATAHPVEGGVKLEGSIVHITPCGSPMVPIWFRSVLYI